MSIYWNTLYTGPFIRVWNVIINQRTLNQTKVSMKKAKTRVLSNGWQVILNLELNDIDSISEEIRKVLDGWETCIECLSIDAKGCEEFCTWFSDINLPRLKSLKITGLLY